MIFPMDLTIFNDSVSLVLVVVPICAALLIIGLARRGSGSITHSELRKRMKHLQ